MRLSCLLRFPGLRMISVFIQFHTRFFLTIACCSCPRNLGFVARSSRRVIMLGPLSLRLHRNNFGDGHYDGFIGQLCIDVIAPFVWSRVRWDRGRGGSGFGGCKDCDSLANICLEDFSFLFLNFILKASKRAFNTAYRAGAYHKTRMPCLFASFTDRDHICQLSWQVGGRVFSFSINRVTAGKPVVTCSLRYSAQVSCI